LDRCFLLSTDSLPKGGFPETADAIFQFLLVCIFETAITLIAIFVVDKIGRKILWMIGSVLMIIALTLGGLVFQYDLKGWYVLVIMFSMSAAHGIGMGPLPWLMMSEIYPNRIRARAVALTTTVIWIFGWFAPWIFPKLREISTNIMGTDAGAIWFWLIFCVLSVIFGLTILPETKGAR